jgi:hypothetical protein
MVLNASYVERKGLLVLGVSEVEFKGTVSNSDANSFDLDGIRVDYDSSGITTDLTGLPDGISDGLFVEVKGSLQDSTTITATRVHLEDRGIDDDLDKVSLEGILTDLVDRSNFQVAGVAVDATSASFSPAGLVLRNGLKVEVEGPVIGGQIQALKVEARDHSIKIEALVSALLPAERSITLSLGDGSITVLTDGQTLLEDSLGDSTELTLSSIASADFLQVQASLDDSGRVVASRIKRDEADDVILQGPVDSFVSDTSITIMGVTFFTTLGSSGTDFETVDDRPISSATFYAGLSNGALVKLKDKGLGVGDGTADEVEYED